MVEPTHADERRSDPASAQPVRLRINWVLAWASLSGGVKSNRLIAEAMARRGHDVVIYHCTARPPWPPPWRARRFARRLWSWGDGTDGALPRHHLERAAVPVIGVPHRPIRPGDVRDADVLVTSWWHVAESVAQWPASKGAKVHYVRHYELHGGPPARVEATYRLPGQKVVIARWLERILRERYGVEDVVCIPNGVDWQQFDSPPRPKRQVPRVGFLYGHPRWKGAHTAFEALERLQRELPELEVIAFGSTPLRADLPQLAHFEFHLRPEQEAIPAIYRSCDCWVVPSITEGLGMPGLEAAASHCPLVVTRSGGPEDYVGDGRNGFLVPVEDPAAMAEAIRSVVTAPPERWEAMSTASYEIARRFDWDRSAERLEALFLDLTRRTSSGLAESREAQE